MVAGVDPADLRVSSIQTVPATIAHLFRPTLPGDRVPGGDLWRRWRRASQSTLLHAVAIVFLLLHTALVFNSKETADNLEESARLYRVSVK
jgi:preprotein translocase subunit SecY